MSEDPRSIEPELSCDAHPGTWNCDPGFRGLEPRIWQAVDELRGVRAFHAGEETTSSTPILVGVGTRLRLDQTDWTIQGCTQGDIFVWHRFRVLDGTHAGLCVEFTQYQLSTFTAWVPDGLAAEDVPSQAQPVRVK